MFINTHIHLAQNAICNGQTFVLYRIFTVQEMFPLSFPRRHWHAE